VVTAYIGLGANLGDREANIRQALSELARSGCRPTKVSSIYETAPVGFSDQPDFLNAVAEIETDLGPRELLAVLDEIEQRIGREETFKWGPRIIDLDILLYGDLRLSEDNLKIPHPEIQQRAFVLTPLAEIAPEARHPVSGLTAREMSAAIGAEGVRKYVSPESQT
jgi:2-amino-4-hydroxy-6-hydroxymethyldihydropteridine diphosphokinase